MADHPAKKPTEYLADYDTGKPVRIHAEHEKLAEYQETPPAAPSLMQRVRHWVEAHTTASAPLAAAKAPAEKTVCMADYATGKPVCFESTSSHKLADYDALQVAKHEPSVMETLRQLPASIDQLLHHDTPAAAPVTPAKPASKPLDTYRE